MMNTPIPETVPPDYPDNPEAGPALDMLIAEHVMGWTEVEIDTAPGSVDLPMGTHPDPDWPFGRQVIPHYSTDIREAWAVVEWMRTRYWMVRVQEQPDGYPWLWSTGVEGEEVKDYRKACVSLHWVSPDRSFRHHIDTTAATAPLAICKAALRVLEEEARRPIP